MTRTRHGAIWVKPPGPVAPGLRIGLLGGSFNPAHEGHMHVSQVGLDTLGLDYVWWLVSPQNPLKPVAGMAPLDQRIAQARAVASHPRILVSGLESELGTRFTVDTLAALKRRFPQVRFVWLMGTDNLKEFQRWRRWQEITALVPIAIVVRPGTTLAPLYAKVSQRLARARHNDWRHFADAEPPALAVIDAPRNAMSATAIRERLLRTTIAGKNPRV
ncbi:MAG: nicotinate-nucleotide adenylyltransferase [Rhizomicrobium sp.]|jgi:nicotinate-nucleotide adenylyltransferase